MIRTQRVDAEHFRLLSGGKDVATVKDGVPVYSQQDARKIAQSVNACEDMAKELRKAGAELARYRAKPADIRPIDLTKLTRNANAVFASISIKSLELKRSKSHAHAPWLELGQCDLRDEGVCFLGSRMQNGVTDFEHSACYAAHIDLIGLRHTGTHGQVSFFEAYLSPDPDRIRIHAEGFNPRRVQGASWCREKNCGKPHLVLPDGNFTPPVYEFARLVAGEAVKIVLGPRWDRIEKRGSK